MRRFRDHLASELYAGRHHELLAATVDSRAGYGGDVGLPYVVGALVFKGRLFEAEAWAQRYLARLGPDDTAFTLFFLAIGYARHSRYVDARAAAGRLWRLHRSGGGALTGFFLYQVLGFYRYFRGRHGNVAHYAARATEIATLARFQYGKYLALDLLGHAEINGGQIGSGLGHLADALTLARQFGDGGSVTSLEAVIAVYEVRFGLADRARLERAGASGLDEDTYSRALVALEYVRQLLLRGAYAEAERRLLETWTVVKSNRHRRLDLWVHIVYAELSYRRGELTQGLGYLAGVAADPGEQLDLSIRIAVLDVECKIRRALGETEAANTGRLKLLALTRRQGSLLGRRRSLRNTAQREAVNLAPEDRVGRLVDLACDPEVTALDKVHRLSEAGLFGLLPTALGLPLGKDSLVLDATGGTIICAGLGGVHVAAFGLTRHVEALLRALAAGTTGREDLVAEIWGYAYNRLKHDGLLYQLVARTRKLLGPFGDRLVTMPGGYELHCALVFGPVAAPVSQPAAVQEDRDSGLPERLQAILKLARARGEVDAPYCRAALGVSRASLTRDMKVLTDRGLLRRQGVGKATRYIVPEHAPGYDG